MGPNGCGKSSLFDTFQKHLKVQRFIGLDEDMMRYYRRDTSGSYTDNDDVRLEFHGSSPSSQTDFKKSLYVRSAYRHDPSFRNTTIEQQGDILDRHTIRRLIDTDRTVQNNYQRIIWRLLGKVTTPDLTTNDIMGDTIGDLRRSMAVVFGDIQLDNLVAVGEKGSFTFTKGAVRNFLYENLSAGEKAAFDLLLDVVVNRPVFDDSLYCVDEPEAHLSTRLQGKLLKELYRLIPDGSQLWLATHSIGMVRTAQEIRSQSPEHVVFLDMGFSPEGEVRNYDHAQIIEPAEPDYEFWRLHYSIALDDIAGLLAPDCVVICEGAAATDDGALDESCYNRIFAREFPRTRFVSVGSASQVEKRMGDLIPFIERLIGGVLLVRFRDRDDLTKEEVERKREEGVRILSGYRNLESLLLSDGLLRRLCESVGRPAEFEAIREARDRALGRVTGPHATDDLKPAAQAVHQVARTVLDLPRAGSTTHAFMRDLLAPLVAADTPEYRKLRADIFGD
ncbi:MAG: AAA family ATPase [Acidobacteriota bacterium]|nr:AAA family ATPase [Acidobacteriota bacterium]